MTMTTLLEYVSSNLLKMRYTAKSWNGMGIESIEECA